MSVEYYHEKLMNLITPLMDDLKSNYSQVYKQIDSENIIFINFNPPALRLILEDISYNHILIDYAFISSNFDLNEQYAIILHEIGHVLDKSPKGTHQIDREIIADKFVADLSPEFKASLKDSLKKLKDFHPDDKTISARIQALW